MSLAPVHRRLLEAVGATVAGDGDWEGAVASARAHGLVAVLDAHARRQPGTPAAVRDELAQAHAGQAARGLLHARELASMLTVLRARSIPCAPLRGVALAERLYGDAAARPAGDIDLLVRRADLDRVARALTALGFVEVDRRRGFAREFGYTLELVKDVHGGVVVEPHWTLAYPPFADALDMERVWAACRPGRVAGVDTLLLAPAAVLLNLCLHVVHKAPDVPLLWLLDIARLVGREGHGLDWRELVALARGAGVEGQVGATLRRVAATFPMTLPAGVLEALAPAGRTPLDPLLGAEAGVDGRESLALFFALTGVRRRARYAAALLFPSPRFMALEYGLTRRRHLAPAYARRVSYFAWQALRGTARLLFR
ncbi:MAG TPA: nucleotidyltransferase family protein [Candidatus Limnocylindria bacterium]|nr:nucleotidyltransferase family protein [Candidatus Limnocylindria bacterium]